jgi:hypothetical protein
VALLAVERRVGQHSVVADYAGAAPVFPTARSPFSLLCALCLGCFAGVNFGLTISARAVCNFHELAHALSQAAFSLVFYRASPPTALRRP